MRIQPLRFYSRQPWQSAGKMLFARPPTVMGIRCFQPRRRRAIVAFFQRPAKATASRWLPEQQAWQ